MNRDVLSEMREHYNRSELLDSEMPKDPLSQFRIWMNQAIDDKLFEPNAMSLATVGSNGQPSCRIVLLKDVIDHQFVFYTNYLSKKGEQILENKKAALLFWWREHERQVRIEGKVLKVSRTVSEDYFKTRPAGSQIGAIVSHQSKVIKTRKELDELYEKTAVNYKEDQNNCPEYWGGYILKPELIEFWQGRANRLHDRFEYQLKEGVWTMVRLAP